MKRSNREDHEAENGSASKTALLIVARETLINKFPKERRFYLFFYRKIVILPFIVDEEKQERKNMCLKPCSLHSDFAFYNFVSLI